MSLATTPTVRCPGDIGDLIDACAELRAELRQVADERNRDLEAELREADRAFEKLASAARRLLYDISLEDHPMPDSAAALADLVFERDAPTDETADAAGEED